MNFLYPGFLFALLAVLIPVIIHLFNFRKFKKVYFSNVDFLKQVETQNSSREKLKNLLILIARILTIVFLVLAFARPFINKNKSTIVDVDNTVSIYIDNSYSMDAINKEGSLLDEAKRRAKDLVKSYAINDKFQLLTNDFEGKHQRLLSPEEFLQALQEVKISAASKDLQQVVNRQEGVFTGNANRFAYLISDFQEGFAGTKNIEKSNEVNLSLVKLNATALPNVAVDSVWFLSPVHQAGATEKLVVRVKNYGKEDAKNIPLQLNINNQQKAVGSINVEAGKTSLDTLSFSGLKFGWQNATVAIKDFPLTFDDQFNFTFNVSKNLGVLSINGDNNPYIKALFSTDSYFQLTQMSESNINYGHLNNYSLIILNEIKNPSSGLAQVLKSYINNGGTVVMFPSLAANVSELSNFLSTLNLPTIKQLNTQAVNIAKIELKHPLFKEVFDALPQQLDLPKANQYFDFNESNKFNKESILALPTGATFFAKYGLGNGQVYLSATSLSEHGSNFARHPLFVPLMLKVAFTSKQQMPLFYWLGNQNQIIIPQVKLGVNQNIKLTGNNFEAIPDVKHLNGKTNLYLADQIKSTGFYSVKLADSIIAHVAFNQDRKESNMNYDDENSLLKLFNKDKGVHFIDIKSDNISTAIAEKNNGTELWKLCLILSLVFIAAEILLVRFFNSSNKYQVHEPLN